jgi:SAM-dependent methyltransferase
MSGLDLNAVVKAWDVADPYRIHPAREHESEDAYWESGRLQADEAAPWIGEHGTVLDFGCGDGRVAIPLVAQGFNVIAVDGSPAMITRLKANGFTGESFVSDGTRLADDFGPVLDAVMCRAVLIHHAHSDIERLVSQFAAVLKPGGHLIVDWPVGPHHERRDWIDVTTTPAPERLRVATKYGLELVKDGKPSVWVKR